MNDTLCEGHFDKHNTRRVAVFRNSRGLNVILTDLLFLQYDQFPKHCVFLIYLGQWAMPSLIFI